MFYVQSPSSIFHWWQVNVENQFRTSMCLIFVQSIMTSIMPTLRLLMSKTFARIMSQILRKKLDTRMCTHWFCISSRHIRMLTTYWMRFQCWKKVNNFINLYWYFFIHISYKRLFLNIFWKLALTFLQVINSLNIIRFAMDLTAILKIP